MRWGVASPPRAWGPPTRPHPGTSLPTRARSLGGGCWLGLVLLAVVCRLLRCRRWDGALGIPVPLAVGRQAPQRQDERGRRDVGKGERREPVLPAEVPHDPCHWQSRASRPQVRNEAQEAVRCGHELLADDLSANHSHEHLGRVYSYSQQEQQGPLQVDGTPWHRREEEEASYSPKKREYHDLDPLSSCAFHRTTSNQEVRTSTRNEISEEAAELERAEDGGGRGRVLYHLHINEIELHPVENALAYRIYPEVGKAQQPHLPSPHDITQSQQSALSLAHGGRN
mmetsp:Transcript_9397/g.34464  ORF Transcript_9397/g.34464 Transcript_9397/m.34464 type:complete len:283 (+) Transcript_9397:227-1075(+)